MDQLLLYATDAVAITILVFVLYYPRHHRRDLVVAFLGVNVGVLAVTGVLTASTVGAGLGLGLFGVLSIIRLRSTELDQRAVAYFFASLAFGLICGMGQDFGFLAPGMIVAILLVIGIADSPRLLPGTERQTIQLDRAIPDRTALLAYLEHTLGCEVRSVSVQRLDLVNDTTLVDVCIAHRQASSRTVVSKR